MDQQIGLEETPGEYVEKLIAVFREAWRILRDDGTLWINLGDSYAGGGGFCATAPSSVTSKSGKYGTSGAAMKSPGKIAGIRPKSLVGIPWRFALAMMDDGWILRRDIIWAKGVSFLPNYAGSSMPESVQDRPSTGHEYIFMFAKSEQYYYDQLAVAEPALSGANGSQFHTGKTADHQLGRSSDLPREDHPTRNLRSVWVINPEPTTEKHYATFPSKLVATMIKAGTSEKGCCPQCGAGYRRVVEKTAGAAEQRPGYTAHCTGRNDGERPGITAGPQITDMRWEPGCSCSAGEPVPATVLDPFSGISSTGVSALKLGRSYIGIELSPTYVAIAERRLRQIDAYQPALL